MEEENLEEMEVADPPGYVEPTPIEIWRARIQIHKRRGEMEIAKWLAKRRPDRQRPRNRFPEEEDETDPRLKPICELNAPMRVIMSLERSGVFFVGELAGFTPSRIRRMDNMGDGGLQMLVAALKPFGVSLRDEK